MGVENELRVVAAAYGDLVLRIEGRELPLKTGRAAVVRSGAVCKVIGRTESNALIVRAPGELAQGLQLGLSGLDSAIVVPEQSALLAPFAAFAYQAAKSKTGESGRLAEYYLERLLQEMLLGLLAELSTGPDVPKQSPGAYWRAVAILNAQFTDPTLTTNAIAESVNLSRRQLEREFAKHGTTVRSELRRLRVQLAKEMLTDSDYSMLSVDQIAKYVGFSGSSSLARAMAQSGLGAPTSFRHEGSAPSAIPNASRAGRIGALEKKPVLK